MGRLRSLPVTPASSKASWAADLAEDLPLIGQPLGITQRLVSRLVITSTSTSPAALRRHGRAANWARGSRSGSRLEGLLTARLGMAQPNARSASRASQ